MVKAQVSYKVTYYYFFWLEKKIMDIGFQTGRQNLVDVRYRVLPFRERFSQNFTQKMRGGVYAIDNENNLISHWWQP